MNNLGKKIPKACLKNTVGASGGPPPPPGNRSLDSLKTDYAGNNKMINTMQNVSKGMVGIVNGAMQVYRTLACVICSGSSDWKNIFVEN